MRYLPASHGTPQYSRTKCAGLDPLEVEQTRLSRNASGIKRNRVCSPFRSSSGPKVYGGLSVGGSGGNVFRRALRNVVGMANSSAAAEI